MKIKNFSYNINKGNYMKLENRRKMKIFSIKKYIIYVMIFMIIFVSIFPVTKVHAATTYTQKLTNGIDSFPESYQNLLRQFVDDTFHDNWNFQAYYTGIDWNDFISGESEHGRNRVHSSFDAAHRCSCGNLASEYYCANSQITSYFIDPRNFINERNIFQFLDVSYNSEIYTRAIVEKMVKKYKVFNYGQPITFVMSDENDGRYNQEVSMTYTDIIMKAAEVSRMSPISMIIKIVQEVGSSGSGSTDGQNATYPNTYNFFNIGASDTGDAILNGLEYANNKGWHCPYTSIVEGAEFNAKNYIAAGQNTSYFYKYDCVGTKILKVNETQEITSYDLYHQYMTNIQDPYSQSAALFETYTNEGLLTESLNFIIPVFNNMPDLPVDKISSLSNSDQDLYYADITSSLFVRDSPSGNIIKTIYKDDLVIMLQRNYNSSWDKIQLCDGQVGYTMTKYLEKYEPHQNGGNSGGGTGGEETPPIEEEVIKPIPNIGYGYADVSSSLNVRKGPGTAYGVVASLSAKEEFVILSETDNWYEIRLSNSVNGYVSKDYVQTLEYIKADEDNKTITIIPNVKANIVAGKLNAKAYSVKKSDVEILDNSLGTGYVIKLDDKEYTIVKAGDVSGDGVIDARDSLRILKYSVGTYELKDNFAKAADLNNDTIIDSRDSLRILKYSVGNFDIRI